jgi:LacI family transcriptional regulator
VSRVVNKYPHVRRATREKVLRAIAELKYIPNAAARGLKQSRSELIALIITDISSPFYTAVARGAEDAARAAGLSLILGNSDEEPRVEAEYLRVMGERRVDGVILAPTDQAREALTRNLPPGLPVVLFDRSVPGIDTDLVRCNTQDGVRQLTDHLLGLGHRRIAMVGGMPTVSTWPERVAGYTAALRNANLAVHEPYIIPGDYRQESGVLAVQTLLAADPVPQAIIAANAQVGLGVLDELARHGLRVPRDVAVAAIDDPLPNVPFFPRLTVVTQPGYQMGKGAVELLLARLQGTRRDAEPWRLVFEARLRVGVSCGEEVLGVAHASGDAGFPLSADSALIPADGKSTVTG